MTTPLRTKGAPIARLLFFTALLAACFAATSRPSEADERSWNRSGRRVALPSLEGRKAAPLAGGFSWFCSAKEVRALCLQRDTLWIGTEGGLFAMSLSLDAIEPVRGPASPSIHAIAIDAAGTLWVGGDHSASSRSGGRWRHYTAEANPLFRRVRCLVPGEDRLWIGSFGAGSGYVSGDALTVIACSDSIIDERVLAIAERSATTYYMGTASGLVLADTSGWRSLRYGSRLPIGAVRSLAFDEEGDLFCSIAEQGVAIYSFGRVNVFGTGPETPGANVHAFSFDPSTRRMWAAGDSGVFMFDGTAWMSRLPPEFEGKRRRFLSMQHDAEGNCYLGTDDGAVVIVSRGGVRAAAVPQPFRENCVPRVRLAGGSIWCMAGDGMYVKRAAFVKEAAPPALYSGEMTDFLPLENGTIWVTSRFGVLRAAGRRWEVYDRRNAFATEYFIRVARDSDGRLWLASADAGVVSYASGGWTAYTREYGLPANDIADLIVDGAGVPWIATRGGQVAQFTQGIWRQATLPRALQDRSVPVSGADSIRRYDPAIRFLGDATRESGAPGAGETLCLGLDRAGNCLVAGESGIYRMTDAGFVLVELPGRFRRARPTAVIGSSRGELWLGTAGSGILIYRRNEWLQLTGSNALSDDYVRSLCEDTIGNIWIGTQAGGLTKYAPAGEP